MKQESIRLIEERRINSFVTDIQHSGIIFQSGYNSGHIDNPFPPLFYPYRSEYLAPFHVMWPKIDNQCTDTNQMTLLYNRLYEMSYETYLLQNRSQFWLLVCTLYKYTLYRIGVPSLRVHKHELWSPMF